jgi:hypothetical protein
MKIWRFVMLRNKLIGRKSLKGFEMYKFIPLALLLFVSFVVLPGSIFAQPPEPQLPEDLLFSTGTAEKSYRFYNAFAWVDAQTLQATPFYTDETIQATYMTPISWSPDGHYLAYLRLDDWDVCILTRAGVVQTCFVDKTSEGRGFDPEGKDYMVTWSEDEQKVYLVTDNGNIRSLIEADVTTGQTLRTLYQYDTQGEWPPRLYWTPALDYIAVFNETGRIYGAGFLESVFANDVTVIRLATNETFTMPTELPELGTLSFCPQSSPLGHYLITRGYIENEQPGYAIFDPVGNLISALPYSRFQSYSLEWVYCPTWQADEQAFYFLGGSMGNAQSDYTASIFKYSIADDTLTLYAPIEPPEALHDTGSGGYPIPPLVVSPEGTHIAIEFTGQPLAPGEPLQEMGVLFPSGELIRFNDPFLRSLNPLWIPPLRNEMPFSEDFESGDDKWTLTDRWASASSQHHSGSLAVRSARGTDYTAFTERLTLNDPLDLSEATAPLLTYWSRYKLSSHETIRVQASVDGSGTWTTIQTISNLTNNTQWMRQRVDLSPYIGQSIRLRFVFTAAACSSNCTPNTVWWIDDITIADQPPVTFADDFELGIANWTAGTHWGRVDVSSHSGNWSTRHARGTDYTAYTSLLSLNVPLDLTTSDIPVLTFWTRYRLSSLEPVQVQVKPAGGSWTTMWSRINMTNLTWTPWQLDLSAYRGQTLELRFRFHGNECTQNCMTNPSWWLDDVLVAELPPPSGDLPFVDDFENGTPVHWNMSSGWTLGVDSTDPDNTYAVGSICTDLGCVSPVTMELAGLLDLTGVRHPTLHLRMKYWLLGYPAYGAIQVSADGGGTWDTLQEIEGASSSSWEPTDLDLSQYAGRAILLRFELYSDIPAPSGDLWFIDDVIIQETAP